MYYRFMGGFVGTRGPGVSVAGCSFSSSLPFPRLSSCTLSPGSPCVRVYRAPAVPDDGSLGGLARLYYAIRAAMLFSMCGLGRCRLRMKEGRAVADRLRAGLPGPSSPGRYVVNASPVLPGGTWGAPVPLSSYTVYHGTHVYTIDGCIK